MMYSIVNSIECFCFKISTGGGVKRHRVFVSSKSKKVEPDDFIVVQLSDTRLSKLEICSGDIWNCYLHYISIEIILSKKIHL